MTAIAAKFSLGVYLDLSKALSLQAIQEAEDFFVNGQKARFGEAKEVFNELGI